ncbi:MAG TPA: tetratricopeptide repeat protein, partial [Sphingomonadaceae bacterium]|nr:tetratricopeptide repeat protein [Sphingomonadaceae bacterium]
MSLLAELKRRNVFRVGLFYIVSAWLVVQVAETLLPIFDVPDGVLRAIVLVMALGFVPALLFAWAFEMTPDGLKREKDVRVGPETKHATGQKLNWATLIVAVAAIALLAVDRLLPSGDSNEIVSLPASTTSEPVSAFAEDTDEPVNPRSVAVLPFTTRSSDPEDVFFTDGMHDDLLTQLAKIGALKVISRTSVMEYGETTKKIPEIAEELKVAAIVEGGVQRAGNRVRINAQLIAAETDLHLWAETFDRELTAENIFEIQSDIARNIATALQAALTPSEERRLDTRLTDNLLAWEAYRRSLGYLDLLTPSSVDQAESEARRALALDEDFAAAHALLARAHMSRYWFFGSRPSDRDAAWAALEAGRAIDPDGPQLDIAEAYYHYWGFLDYDEALAAVDRAIEAIPNDAELHNVRAFALRRSGQFAEAIASLERAHELDPRSALAAESIIQTYKQLGHFEAAQRWLRLGIDIAPDSDWIKL